MSAMGERSKVEVLTQGLALWLAARTDAPQALCILCEVTAEFIKLSDNPQATRDKWIAFLDRYLAQPNRLVEACGDAARPLQ